MAKAKKTSGWSQDFGESESPPPPEHYPHRLREVAHTRGWDVISAHRERGCYYPGCFIRGDGIRIIKWRNHVHPYRVFHPEMGPVGATFKTLNQAIDYVEEFFPMKDSDA